MKCQLRLFSDREEKLIIILGRKVHPISFPSHPTPRTESRFVINEILVMGVYWLNLATQPRYFSAGFDDTYFFSW